MKRAVATQADRVKVAFLLVALTASSTGVPQSGGNYEITSSTIDAGGGVSIQGELQISGALGQPDSMMSQSEDYEVRGGFWAGGSSDLIFRGNFE